MSYSKDILIYAFRYCLGRKSYAPRLMQEELIKNISAFEDIHIEQMIEEIKECSFEGCYLREFGWQSLIEFLELELEYRGGKIL